MKKGEKPSPLFMQLRFFLRFPFSYASHVIISKLMIHRPPQWLSISIFCSDSQSGVYFRTGNSLRIRTTNDAVVFESFLVVSRSAWGSEHLWAKTWLMSHDIGRNSCPCSAILSCFWPRVTLTDARYSGVRCFIDFLSKMPTCIHSQHLPSSERSGSFGCVPTSRSSVPARSSEGFLNSRLRRWRPSVCSRKSCYSWSNTHSCQRCSP